jgi:hypothetical protein
MLPQQLCYIYCCFTVQCTESEDSITYIHVDYATGKNACKILDRYLTHLYSHLPDDADHSAQNGTDVGELKINLRSKDDFRNRIFAMKRGVVPFHR